MSRTPEVKKHNNPTPQPATGNTWVFGKDGWYMARGQWNAEYSAHLESLGYKVVKSFKKPEVG